MKIKLDALLLIAIGAANAAADGLKDLENFVKNTRSGSAQFTQTVTSPSRMIDGQPQPPRVKTSSGSFDFQRPNRFKFHYKKPFEQIIVADGIHLWLYDVDLQQATQRRQQDALANTPAAIIASSSDLAALRVHYHLEPAPDKDGLSWVQAKPKGADSTLQLVRIGFKGEALAQLEITDTFGQRSVVSFSSMQLNPALPPDAFKLNLPKGVEVLKQ